MEWALFTDPGSLFSGKRGGGGRRGSMCSCAAGECVRLALLASHEFVILRECLHILQRNFLTHLHNLTIFLKSVFFSVLESI